MRIYFDIPIVTLIGGGLKNASSHYFKSMDNSIILGYWVSEEVVSREGWVANDEVSAVEFTVPLIEDSLVFYNKGALFADIEIYRTYVKNGLWTTEYKIQRVNR